MAKSRTKISEKLRASLQQEIGSACPICTNSDVGHFQVHHLDENPENNVPDNLLMLCANCHSKITKGDISPSEAKGIKQTLQNVAIFRAAHKPAQANNFHGDVTGVVIGSGNTVNIDNRKTVKSKYPPGCIGHNVIEANYISYLISRYHDFKEWEVGKDNMRYALFPSQLKKHFKLGAQRTIYNLPEHQFKELCSIVQQRIRGTKLARTTKKTESELYQTFEQYVQEQMQ